MLIRLKLLLAISLAIAWSFPFTAPAQTLGKQRLHGRHVPEVVSHLQPMGRLPATNRLHLAIGLPLRNQEALSSLLEQIYNPDSPQYRQYLTPEQFTERFGPTEQDYQAVITFAQANGLSTTTTHGNRLLLDVSGPAANVEKAFNVTVQVYQHPTENRTFYAPDAEPLVDSALPILDVSGLDNYRRPHPRNIIRQPSGKATVTVPKSGSGPGGTYFGNDFRSAYAPGVTLRGSGQTVGLFEVDGYYLTDITNYEGHAGFTNVPLQNVLLNGFSGTPVNADYVLEVSLDIEMAIAMAPALAKVVVFEGNPANFQPNDILNAMAASNSIKQLSCSWGWQGGPSATTENIFQQMAAQGQSFFNASGDSDAFTDGSGSVNGVDKPSTYNTPSSSPYIMQVGGTALTTSGSNWSSETVWNWGGGQGSSGGISSYYSIPSWQTNIDMTNNKGSTTNRNIPDIALTADDIYVYHNNGSTDTVGGTSCAAPLWAGFTALVNQQAASAGRPAVGFINPAIYALCKGTNYNSCFHDVTTGSNTWSQSTTKFYATNGYDLCTGWGTPAGSNLISALAITCNSQPWIRNGGFETGDFSGWQLVGNTVIGGVIYNAVESSNAYPAAVHSGTYGAFLGDTNIATLSQVVPTYPNQSYLLSFWLNNPTNLPTQKFKVAWNTNATSTNTIYSITNPPSFSWTNLTFVVTANGYSVTIQFSAENDQEYFGLDDVSLVPIPNPPTLNAASGITTNGFTANWTPSTDATNYLLDVATDSTFGSFVSGYNNKSVGNVTSNAVTGLSAGTTYYYRLRANDSSGTSDNSTTNSVITIPAPPMSNAASGITTNSFTANWTASTGATNYFLDVSTNNGFSTHVIGYSNRIVGNVLSTNVTSLAAGTTYYHRMRASNSSGISSDSATITVVTIPFAPVVNAASGITTTGFTANWNTSTGATNYLLDVASDSAFGSFTTGYSNRNVGNVLTTSVTNLAAGTTNYYRLRAANSGGTSVNSATNSVATISAPSFTVVARTTNGLTLTWSSLAGISYQVQYLTNLAQTNWINLGSAITATNSATTTTNAIGPDPKRFYRIRQLP